MITKRSIIKEIAVVIYLVIGLIGISQMPAYENSASDKIAMLAIIGIPVMLYIFSLVKSLVIKPIKIELSGKGLTLEYLNHKRANIGIEQISEVTLKICSQKTAIITMYFKENNANTFQLDIHKKAWSNFVEFFKQLKEVLPEEHIYKVVKAIGVSGKNCCEFMSPTEWYEYFTNKKTMGEVVSEIINEGIITKAIIIVLFIFVIFIRSFGEIGGIDIFLWITGIAIIIYLLYSFFLRMKGYSRKECIESYFMGIVNLMFVSGAITGIISIISKFKS